MNSTNRSLADSLFQPKILFTLLFVWLFVVIVGSGIAIYVTQYSFMSDAEVEQLLSENERLAQNVNVAAPTAVPQQYISNESPAYPDRLVIPHLSRELPVSNPQTRDIVALDAELKSAVVRYPDAATLGQQGGNTLIFGHSSHLPVVRNQLFKAFNNIETLTIGDRIEVYSERDVFVYHVSRVYEASATDDSIPLTVPGHMLTLLTCDTFGAKSDRFVVEATYVGKNI